ncbi:MAG: C39 family peptidase [Deltaproteobacteria bacterium]|jgi:hypothetical protein|nr:C39 family peptidase [Deltaproteobacteria bacterium]
MEKKMPCVWTKFGLLLTILFLTGCFSTKPLPKPFTMPQDSRLVLGMPFFPDETNLCGPASLAAVLTFQGYPTTIDEAAAGVQRWDLRGSLGPDLVIYARSRGAKATFLSMNPELLLDTLAKQVPVIVLVNMGAGPVVQGHFMVAVGYTFEGIVVNSGLIQQAILPWSRFLTDWFAMGNFAIVIEPNIPADPSDPSDPPVTPVSSVSPVTPISSISSVSPVLKAPTILTVPLVLTASPDPRNKNQLAG